MEKPKEIPYVLGIDLGADSVGWAVLSCGEEEEEGEKEIISIHRAGVRIFDAGTEGDVEAGKDESRAKNRREKRLIRRQIERRAMRTFRLFRLLQQHSLLPSWEKEILGKQEARVARDKILADLDRELLKKWTEKLRAEKAPEEELRLLPKRFPYVLRARALDEKLEPYELGRALYHLGQRRGFLSNRKVAAKKDEDKGVVKEGIKKLKQEITDAGARTLGEYFARINPEEERIRTRYTHREMYKEEFEEIWKTQQNYLPALLSSDLKGEIHKIIFSQRPLKSQAHLIGECEHEPGQKRAPIASLAFQRFRILQNVNNLKIYSDGLPRFLTDEERQKVISALEGEGGLLDDNGFLSFTKIKELLGLKKTNKINMEKENDKGLIGNRTAQKLRTIFKEKWDELSFEKQEALVDDILSMEDDEALMRRAVKAWGLDEDAARELAETEFDPNYCGLSRKAMKKLIPLMEQGQTYMAAVAKIYDPPPPEPENFLPPVRTALKALRNPVVERSLTELRKVVNAIIRQYGKPYMIRIELARDIRHSKEIRKKLNTRNKKNQSAREKARNEILKQMKNLRISRNDELKYLLAEECGWECPYTGKKISVTDLFGAHPKFDIEHIIPFSRCQDNSFLNKTLADAEEQRKVKGNKTPWEAYSGNPERYQQIIERVEKFQGDAKDEKRRRFLLNGEELEKFCADFSSRQMNDTRYASKLAVRYLSRLYGASGLFKTPDGKMMVLGVDEKGKRRVQVCAGGVTAHIRNNLGLRTVWNSILEETYPKLEEKEETEEPEAMGKERIDHRHHAVDAIAIGLVTPAMVKKLADAARKAPAYKKRLFANLPPPWPNFLDEVRQQINSIIPSHRVSKKVNGPLHEETNYSPPKKDPEGKLCRHVRKKLESLTKNEIDDIVDPVIQRKVKEKLKELGIKDIKKERPFTNPANLPFLEAKDGRKIPIRKVRIRKPDSAFLIGKNGRERYVTTAANHHLEVIGVFDQQYPQKKITKWECQVVDAFQAMRRLKAGEPVVKKDHGPGKCFLFSLAGGEIIELDKGNGTRGLYRIRTYTQTTPKNGRIWFVEIKDARKKEDIQKAKEWKSAMIDTLRQLNCRKVSIGPLGEIKAAND